jgi:Ca-activated chloride channel homolog
MHLGLATWWPLGLMLAVPLIWWLTRRSRGAVSRRRIVLAAILRSLALLSVALALAGPSLYTRTHAISVVYALDISRSIEPAFLSSALDWIRKANAQYRPAHASYVVFADRAELLRNLNDIQSVAVREEGEGGGGVVLDQRATDIEQGIATAVLGFLPDYSKRLVLITDGNQTQGDMWRELPRLQSERVRVFALPAPARFGAEAWIDAVEAPDGVRQLQPVAVRVRLTSSVDTPARLQVAVAGAVVSDRSIQLTAGENQVPLELRFKRAGANLVQAKLATPNGHAESLLRSIWVGPRLRLLYVEGGRTPARYLADALAAQGIDVKPMTPERFAEEPGAALHGVDAVLLSDVPADRLDEETTHRLESFVRDLGGGLVFVAGENTYGKAGFSGSGVERLLPVKFEARRKRKELDLVLLIDRSYSMHGRKLELAKSAALATLDLMEEQHRLAVVAFDSQPHDVVPLAEVGSKRRAEDFISSMTSAGRTDIYNALWRARELLKASQAKTKHVILLSDGETAPPPNARPPSERVSDSRAMLEMLHGMGYGHGEIGKLVADDQPTHPPSAGGFEDLVADMAAANITLSTVAIGDKPNLPLMTGLAQWGNGKSYVAQRDSEIPALFVTEARRLLGESLIEEPFRPVAKGRSEMLAGIDFASGPELKGFVASKAKRFSDVLLQAKQEQPLLAETRYGLGKTVAFLSDAKNRWAVDWLAWPGYGKFWAQVVRDAGRGATTQEFTWQVKRNGGEGSLKLIALFADGTFRNDLWPRARVWQPNGESNVVVLRQSAPGTYNARIGLEAASAGPYRFELLPGPGLSQQEVTQIGERTLYYSQSDEFRARPTDVGMLKALSERTGGKFAPKTDEIFARSADGGMLATPLWPALAGAALLLFLLEIVVRRAPWSFLDGAPARR